MALKKITTVDAAESVSSSANLYVEDSGAFKRITPAQAKGLLGVDELKSAISDIAAITHGANILPPDYEDGFITSTGDYSSPSTAFRSRNFVPVSGTNIVQMSANEGGTTTSSVYVACYDSTKTFLSRIMVNKTPTTLPTGTAYIKVCSTAINAATAATYEMGLALSAEAATYEAYKVIPVLNENTVFPELVLDLCSADILRITELRLHLKCFT